MKLTEHQLRRAAVLAENYAMKCLPDENSFDYKFSEAFEKNMDILLQRMSHGKIKTDGIKMGWQYYTKRSIAAVLLGFLLTCATMPEVVVAGYHKLIEVVEQFVLHDARTILNEYTNINAATDFAADAEYLYYQGKEGEIYRRPLNNLEVESERMQLMTVDENYTFEDYALGKLYEENGSIYLNYYTGGAIMGSSHQYRLLSDGTVESVYHGKYEFFDFDDFQILVTTYPSLEPQYMTIIDEKGERTLGDAEYFYRSGKADDTGYTLGSVDVGYWKKKLYVLAFRYGEASRICSVDIKTGHTVPVSRYETDSFKLENGIIWYTGNYTADGTMDENNQNNHLYALNVKNGHEEYIGQISKRTASWYEPVKNGVYYCDTNSEELIFYNSSMETETVINAGAKLENLYRQNDYIVAHFTEGTAGTHRLMVFHENGDVYTSADISDKATVNENGVLIYRLAGSNQLIKADLK